MSEIKQVSRSFDSATQEILGKIVETRDKRLIELARANAGLILHALDRIR